MTIDAFASKPWYVDHLAPIWRALGADAGRFHVRGSQTVAAAAGLAGVTEERPAGSDPIVTVATSDYLAALRAGRRRIALGQHGAGQSYGTRHPSYPGGDGQDDVGLFLVPNATAARVTLERYPAARVAIVGCPKVDRLPRRIADGRTGVVAISTHWNARIAPGGRIRLAGVRAGPARAREDPPRDRPRPPSDARPDRAVLPSRRHRGRGQLHASTRARRCPGDGQQLEHLRVRGDRPARGRAEPTAVPPRDLAWAPVLGGRRRRVNVDAARDLEPAIARALELRPVDVAAREAALDIVYQPRHGSAELAAAALRAWAG
jgi:hypothetical protein